MTEDEIRNHIFITLAQLYKDPLHRSQYKKFEFEQSDKKGAEKILTQLARNYIVEQLQPWVVRLTDLGYQLILSDLEKPDATDPDSQNYKKNHIEHLPPAGEELEKLAAKMEHPDYFTASYFSEGQSEIYWATSGIKKVTGYTIDELRKAGGTIALIHGPENKKRLEQIALKLINNSEIKDSLEITTKTGHKRTIQFLAKIRHDSGGNVTGTLTAIKDITSSDE